MGILSDNIIITKIFIENVDRTLEYSSPYIRNIIHMNSGSSYSNCTLFEILSGCIFFNTCIDTNWILVVNEILYGLKCLEYYFQN